MACLTPFTTRNKLGQSVPVPCGKCPDCKGRRASGWSFRLMQHEKDAMTAQFITLTYDTSTVPITRNGFMSLDKRDLQLFFKRLRKSQGKDSIGANMPPIKYYAVGEYGTKTKRPHYHIILFNACQHLIQPAWGKGHVHYGTVSGASIGYTLKYMMKEPKIPMHRNDDRLREFSLMSKGIGENYLTNKMVLWHHADMINRMYVTTQDGKKVSMPRYYKDKIYVDVERKVIGHYARQTALQKILEHEIKMYELHGENAASVQVQIHKQQFKKMYNDAERGRSI